MFRDHSLCVVRVCSYSCVNVYPVLLLLLLLCTKFICTCQACQSEHCAAVMPTLYTYCSSDTRKIVCLTATKFEPFVFPILGFVFAYVSNILHYREFVWLLPASYKFLLCNSKRSESGSSDIKRGSVCALVGNHWCGGLYFACAITRLNTIHSFVQTSQKTRHFRY
jgi:hypothetical protein